MESVGTGLAALGAILFLGWYLLPTVGGVLEGQAGIEEDGYYTPLLHGGLLAVVGLALFMFAMKDWDSWMDFFDTRFGPWILVGASFALILFGGLKIIRGLRRSKVVRGASTGSVTHKTCPYCAETIKAAAVVCKHCNRDVA